ncbi:GNAT family N-acetyltransferase [Clostridium folliculivorans]|uniref:GNAT family N-acetyltransferase n=1 Tax=Clostridium folliculivorans TaxID=2886038 RepID=UPI0021C3E57B|nr:GNAT family N-acetyltransferase [Clostridium folliculivorans]GKU29288.1 hypothetical protein CFB3_13940 [Clostridium folliculivorans]
MKLEIFQSKKKDKELISQCIEIDKTCYEEKYRGTEAIYHSWFEKNNNIFTFAIDYDTNNVVGYMITLSLTNKAYLEMKAGNTIDLSLDSECILPFIKGRRNFIYVASIAVRDEYQGQGISSKIMEYSNRFLDKLKDNGIIIEKVLGDAVNEKMLKSCINREFKEKIKSNHNSTIVEKHHKRNYYDKNKKNVDKQLWNKIE